MTIVRRLLNVLSALSLLLLLATLCLWGRSYFARDMVTAQSGGVQRVWSSDAGRIGLGLFTFSPDNGYDHDWTRRVMRPGDTSAVAGAFEDHQHFGVGWDVRGTLAFSHGGIRYLQSAREWWVSYWLVALLTLPLSTILLRRITAWTVLHLRLALQRRRENLRGFPLDLAPPTNAS